MTTPQRHEIPEELAAQGSLPAVLLPYQARLLATTARSPLTICEKSRRIGMTWGVGADAVLTSGASRAAGGMDTLYIGYNLDMAREFIDVCAMWARAFLPAAGDVEEFLFKQTGEDGAEKDIQAFRISFASGFEIVALTSKPRSLRGRQGYVIFDEAAFHDELEEMLKAALPLLMWGGKVLVISTHDGQDNPFNGLIAEVRAKKRAGEVLRVTFDDAIADGLYERIALVKGLEATEEARLAWIATVRKAMGDAAGEELDCIPRAGSGTYLSGAAIEACMSPEHTVARFQAPDGFELRPMAERNAVIDAFLEEHVKPGLDRLDPKLITGLGEDFGRNVDLSVIAVGQERSDLSVVVPLIVEMGNTPIEQQKRVVRYIVERLNRFVGAKFDKTGNGLALAEWAQEEFGHYLVEAVQLSQAWYLEHGPLLKQHVEDQTVELPQDSEIKADCRAVKLVRGVPSIPDSRKDGRHGDAAVALMMLVAALKGEVEMFDYRPVPKGSATARPVRITAGFSNSKGLW